MSSGILFNFKREGNTAIFDNMDEPWGDYTKWNKPDTERQILYVITCMWASLIAQSVKNLPAMQEIQVWFLDQEDLWEKEMATHFSILVWEIPWTEKPDGLQLMGSQKSWSQLSN